MHLSILIVHLICLVNFYPEFANAKKPYDVEFRSFEPYKNVGTDSFESKTLRVNRKGRNIFVLTGDFCLLTNLGEDSMMMYEITKKSDTSDKYTTIHKGAANICEFCSTNTDFYPRFRTFTNFPEPNTCPFPKGNYTITNYTFDDKPLPAIVPLGIYIVKVSYTRENKIIFGYTITVQVSTGS